MINVGSLGNFAETSAEKDATSCIPLSDQRLSFHRLRQYHRTWNANLGTETMLDEKLINELLIDVDVSLKRESDQLNKFITSEYTGDCMKKYYADKLVKVQDDAEKKIAHLNIYKTLMARYRYKTLLDEYFS